MNNQQEPDKSIINKNTVRPKDERVRQREFSPSAHSNKNDIRTIELCNKSGKNEIITFLSTFLKSIKKCMCNTFSYFFQNLHRISTFQLTNNYQSKLQQVIRHLTIRIKQMFIGFWASIKHLHHCA